MYHISCQILLTTFVLVILTDKEIKYASSITNIIMVVKLLVIFND